MNRESRLNHTASQEAIHEAGHALERYLLHGTTGAMLPVPLPGKKAGAESEPLPDCLREPNPNESDEERVVAGPYSEKQRARLEQEIKTTLAGSVAEGLDWGREPLEVLEDPEQKSDADYAYGIAKLLWPAGQYNAEAVRLASEVEMELDSCWQALVDLAERYDSPPEGLSVSEVKAILIAHDVTPGKQAD